MGILVLLIVGLVAGFLARALVPGDDSMGLLPTLILGLVGAFIGGLIGWLFNRGTSFTDFNLVSVILAVVGAVIALLAYRQIQARS